VKFVPSDDNSGSLIERVWSVIEILRQLPSRMVVSEKKSMKRMAILALLVGSLCGSALCQYSAEFSSYYSGNRYDFRLTREQLSNTAAWLEDQPNPLLSPRTATNAALTYLRTLFDNASVWRVNEIKLVQLSERWVYVVSFTPPLPRDCQDCMTTPFSIAVMMDGNALTAVVSRWEPATPSVNK
jgi:hypothetical protein